MTLIQKINNFVKKKYNFFLIIGPKTPRIRNFNPVILITFIIFFSGVFFFSSNFINKKNKEEMSNLKKITETNEFSNLVDFFTSKINSPYEEIEYVIRSNDTIEKILKKYKIRDEDIKNISLEIKKEKLSNIYSGRKVSMVFKKLEDGSKTIVNFLYPVNNTTSVEIRKFKDTFTVKENILQLYKKVIVKIK